MVGQSVAGKLCGTANTQAEEKEEMIDQQGYKKTYKPLVLWLILFIAASAWMPTVVNRILQALFQITWVEGAEIRMMLMFMLIAIDGLMWMIYAGEYVYWINGGPSFEEAKAAGSEKRKAYAAAHLSIFIKMTLVACVYLLFSLLFHFPVGIDIAMISSVVVVASIMTIPIRFN